MQTCESLRLICQRQWYNYISVRNLISALKSNDHNVPRVQSVSTCAIYTYLTNKSPACGLVLKKNKKKLGPGRRALKLSTHLHSAQLSFRQGPVGVSFISIEQSSIRTLYYMQI
jgi:hypothetical protein